MAERRPFPRASRRLLTPSSWGEARFLTHALRTESVGGGLLLAAAIGGLVWANSPWAGTYEALRGFIPWPGGARLGLDLDLAHWAGDGLLAIFFFVVGLELKREFSTGDLRDPRRAALPVAAAVGGMVAPALVFVAVTWTAGGDALRGWAVPTPTDIAFALAVLAIIGSHLPIGLRGFLLTLAVVDDLLAITIIAVFYTARLHPVPLFAAMVAIAAFALLVRRRRTWWFVLIGLAVVAWALLHASGVHATIAGALLGFVVPATHRPAGRPSLAEHLEHRWRPVSAGVAVPVFAFFAAGVSLRGDAITDAVTDPVAIGVAAGLVVGKVVGIVGSTYLVARFTRAELDDELAWTDLSGVALLAGIGFTVSLLIGELAFGADGDRQAPVTFAIVTGSLISAALASIVLSRRNAVYRRLAERDARDSNADGIPDLYQPAAGRTRPE